MNFKSIESIGFSTTIRWLLRAILRKIIIKEPQSFQEIGANFYISGWIPKSWLTTSFNQCLSLEYIDLEGKTFMGTNLYVNQTRRFERFLNIYKFNQIGQLSWSNISWIEKSHGRIVLRISSMDEDRQSVYIPIIVKQFLPNDGLGQDIVNKHANVGEKVSKLRRDLKSYYKEFKEIHQSFLHNVSAEDVEDSHILDSDMLWGMFEILNKSETKDEESPYVKEIRLKEQLAEKYKETLVWRGPLAGASLFRINGFIFKIHSHDYGKHFHIIHKGRGIDARFSFPEIELINYKKDGHVINAKELKVIQSFLRQQENFKKLGKEFERRDKNK